MNDEKSRKLEQTKDSYNKLIQSVRGDKGNNLYRIAKRMWESAERCVTGGMEMREIEFRGKRRIYGNWVVGDLVNPKEPTVRIFTKSGDGFFVEESTVGQYTGVKDSKGNKIYEGDILKVTAQEKYNPNRDRAGGIVDYDFIDGSVQIGVVEFNTDTFEYSESRVLEGDSLGLYNIPIGLLENAEVVGNIHDGLDILNKEE